jgi:hypothetical protein
MREILSYSSGIVFGRWIGFREGHIRGFNPPQDFFVYLGKSSAGQVSSIICK